MQQQINIRKTLTFGFIFVGSLAIIWYIYYTFFTFHITSTTPHTREISTLTPSLHITVNRDIESIAEISVTPRADTIESYSFSGREIYISLSELTKGEQITITLSEVKSADGDILTKRISFTPKEVAAEDLPEAQLKELLEKQDSNTDSSADPIQSVVPHSTLQYDLALTARGQDDNGRERYSVDARILLSQADVSTDESGAIARIKDAINDYLRSNTINPDDYQIDYVIEY